MVSLVEAVFHELPALLGQQKRTINVGLTQRGLAFERECHQVFPDTRRLDQIGTEVLKLVGENRPCPWIAWLIIGCV